MNVLQIVVVAIALIGCVPLGLSVGRDANARAWRRLWPVVGVIGALSLVVPSAGVSVALSVFYAAATVALALSIPARLVHRPWPATEFAVVGALAAPLVGGVILVAEQLGSAPAGGLWWVAGTHAGFAAGMWGAARAAGPIGQASRPGAAGATLLTWAALAGGVLAWWLPGPAAVGGAVVAALGAILVAVFPSRPPEPCEAQSSDQSARLGG